MTVRKVINIRVKHAVFKILDFITMTFQIFKLLSEFFVKNNFENINENYYKIIYKCVLYICPLQIKTKYTYCQIL